jgi:hypothetical protein
VIAESVITKLFSCPQASVATIVASATGCAALGAAANGNAKTTPNIDTHRMLKRFEPFISASLRSKAS